MHASFPTLLFVAMTLPGCVCNPVDCIFDQWEGRVEEGLRIADLANAEVFVENVWDAATAYFGTHDGAETVMTEQLVGERLLNPSFRLDPWGVVYRIEHVDGELQVSSAGPDMEFGTDDDIHAEGSGGDGALVPK